MAVDLAAIRRKVEELNGRRSSSVQLWKPEPGKHIIRGMPWRSIKEGMPFAELQFYYLGDNRRFLAPKQFGKPDPVADLIRKLYSSGSPDDRVIAKKLHPKLTAYMPILDRGHEDKGVQVWGFNKFIYQRLLGFFTDDQTTGGVDFLDPNEGFDMKVEIKPSGKKFNNRDVMDITVDLLVRKTTKLHDNPETMKKLLEGAPANMDEAYEQKSFEEINNILNTWLSTGSAAEEDDGSSRGPATVDAIDTLVKEVKTATKPEVPKAEAKRGKKADIDEPAAKKQTLDEAFAELSDD